LCFFYHSNIGKEIVGEKLLSLAGTEFKKK
jgi:hypothetical protein